MLYLRETRTRLALKLFRGEPAISFEENQLSPGSIGISPLPTPHRHPFQRMCVRSSICFYANFNLDMGRSPGFGSTPADFVALLRLGFPSAPDLKSLTLPAGVTRRTVLQKVQGFRFSFTPLPGSFSPFLHSTMRYRSLRSI